MKTKPIIPKNKAGAFVDSIVTVANTPATRQSNAIAKDRLNTVKFFILFCFMSLFKETLGFN